jgi:riboflavin synthase
MFTGIISAVGRIEEVSPLGANPESGVTVWVDGAGLDFANLKIGDSIAVNGACMTAVELSGNRFRIDVSRESMSRTVSLDRVGLVNLERSMRLGDSLDGHLVTGHIDGVGHVRSFRPVGESYELVVSAPHELAPFLAEKGSIAINGVSLTVNGVSDAADVTDVSINIIPHTLANTMFKQLLVGDGVNLEVDPVARYVARMLVMRQVEPKREEMRAALAP